MTRKKVVYPLGVVLLLFSFYASLALPVATKADPPSGRCSYIGMWLEGPGTGGESPCIPFYGCPNPAAWPFSDRCYAHWGVPDVPNPCQWLTYIKKVGEIVNMCRFEARGDCFSSWYLITHPINAPGVLILGAFLYLHFTAPLMQKISGFPFEVNIPDANTGLLFFLCVTKLNITTGRRHASHYNADD